MITGQDMPDGGSIKIGDTVKLGYVDQIARHARRRQERLGRDLRRHRRVYLGKQAVPSRAYVGAFNFKGSDQQKKVGMLSGGERNRVHMAKMLAKGGNVILLDEPTNDLDVDTLRALEEALESFAGCAVVISHDRLVPRPARDAHPGVRGRQPRRMVRGQLPGLRGGQAPPPGRRRHRAAPDQVPATGALTGTSRRWRADWHAVTAGTRHRARPALPP